MHWGGMAPPNFFKSSLIVGKTSSQSLWFNSWPLQDIKLGPPSYMSTIRTPFPRLKSPLFSHKDSFILFSPFSIKSTAIGRSLFIYLIFFFFFAKRLRPYPLSWCSCPCLLQQFYFYPSFLSLFSHSIFLIE